MYFQSAAALLVFGMAFGWYRLLSTPNARSAIHWSTLVAGAAVLVIALLMLVVPYRVLYHNEMPRVMVGAERCYRLGVHDEQVLLYCPDRPAPRVTTADESLVVPTGITENIFSPRALTAEAAESLTRSARPWRRTDEEDGIDRPYSPSPSCTCARVRLQLRPASFAGSRS